jgi:uncharacterized protein YwbE
MDFSIISDAQTYIFDFEIQCNVAATFSKGVGMMARGSVALLLSSSHHHQHGKVQARSYLVCNFQPQELVREH